MGTTQKARKQIDSVTAYVESLKDNDLASRSEVEFTVAALIHAVTEYDHNSYHSRDQQSFIRGRLQGRLDALKWMLGDTADFNDEDA
jgi:hypothetical protein